MLRTNIFGKRSRRQKPVRNRRISVCTVIPAKAGIQYAGLGNLALDWIPAFAGMTVNAGL